MKRLRGPEAPAFRETIGRHPRTYWLFARGTLLSLAWMVIPCAAVLLLATSPLLRAHIGDPGRTLILFALLALEMAPLYIHLAWTVRTARRVRRLNYLACPNCLFDLSDLEAIGLCPECGFDVQGLDLTASWKALFRWSYGSFGNPADRYE